MVWKIAQASGSDVRLLVARCKIGFAPFLSRMPQVHYRHAMQGFGPSQDLKGFQLVSVWTEACSQQSPNLWHALQAVLQNSIPDKVLVSSQVPCVMCKLDPCCTQFCSSCAICYLNSKPDFCSCQVLNPDKSLDLRPHEESPAQNQKEDPSHQQRHASRPQA